MNRTYSMLSSPFPPTQLVYFSVFKSFAVVSLTIRLRARVAWSSMEPYERDDNECSKSKRTKNCTSVRRQCDCSTIQYTYSLLRTHTLSSSSVVSEVQFGARFHSLHAFLELRLDCTRSAVSAITGSAWQVCIHVRMHL